MEQDAYVKWNDQHKTTKEEHLKVRNKVFIFGHGEPSVYVCYT